MRYPCIMQRGASDCGVAAVATLAAHFGVRVNVEKLKDLAGSGRHGTDLAGMSHASESLGFTTHVLKGEPSALDQIPLPAILHSRNDQGLTHFVVLFEISSDTATLADPSRGLVTQSRSELLETWSGYVLIAYPGAEESPAIGELQTQRATVRALEHLGRNRRSILHAFAWSIGLTLLSFGMALFIQYLVDSVLIQEQAHVLTPMALGILLVVAGTGAFQWARESILARLGRDYHVDVLSEYLRQIFRLPVRFFETRRAGEILARVGDSLKLRHAMSGTVVSVLVDCILLAGSIAIMFFYDSRLALVACASVPFFGFVTFVSLRRTRPVARSAMEDSASLEAHFFESLYAMPTVKAFAYEESRRAEADQLLAKYSGSMYSLQKLTVGLSVANQLIYGLAVVALLWFGASRALAGILSVGQVLFFYSLFGNMVQPMQRLGMAGLGVQDALIALDRIGEVLELQPERDAEDSRSIPRIREGIRFEGVSFSYGRETVLERVDLEIPAGARIALVGESGCGKTTLLNLLLRFYDPTEGRVSIDGRALGEFSRRSLRQSIKLIQQEPRIFSGSLAENICIGRTGISQGELRRAARVASLEEFVDSLPDGFFSLVGEGGSDLSGGQRQRLAIARAVLGHPQVIILDEATSNLDARMERHVQDALFETHPEATFLLVSHRLAAIRDVDLIYVLADGKIAEKGSHEQLVAQNGVYSQLWNSQLRSQTSSPALPVSEAA